MLAAHSFMIISLATIWYFFFNTLGDNPHDYLERMFSVVLVLGILTFTPLIVDRMKHVIIFYYSTNMIVYIIFVLVIRQRIEMQPSSMLSYVVDCLIAFVMSGIIAYQIFRINNTALDERSQPRWKSAKAKNCSAGSDRVLEAAAVVDQREHGALGLRLDAVHLQRAVQPCGQDAGGVRDEPVGACGGSGRNGGLGTVRSGPVMAGAPARGTSRPTSASVRIRAAIAAALGKGWNAWVDVVGACPPGVRCG